ncbi:winged helix-turn-helix transcriptional regulator [Glycomyces harbinensis]|uniref:winged helix-turn-helix transcriptional regulator n=1 Tax=Glycomyces harbinensis TaxID=58114 RepID=UPI001C409B37|nr:helix-turn-helix domain-containing protein [Glycomyces harbinensis]
MIRGDQGRTVGDLVDRIGGKWTLLILATLHDGRLRYTELKRRLPGVSHRMLALALRRLHRDGLVTRTSHPEVPPRVEYALTPLAVSLLPHAVALAGWAAEHRAAIDAHRAAFDGDA